MKKNSTDSFSITAYLTPKLKLGIVTLLLGFLPLPVFANSKIEVSPLPTDAYIVTLKAEMLNVVTKLYIFKYSSIIKGKNVNIS